MTEEAIENWRADAAARDWWILSVSASKRSATNALLTRLGVRCLTPTSYVRRQVGGVRKRNVMVIAPIMPGYLFVAAPNNSHEFNTNIRVLSATRHLLGVMCVNELPYRLPGAVLVKLEAPQTRAELARTRLKPGDVTRYRQGGLRGVDVTVQSIFGDYAAIVMPFLGAERLIKAPLDALVEPS